MEPTALARRRASEVTIFLEWMFRMTDLSLQPGVFGPSPAARSSRRGFGSSGTISGQGGDVLGSLSDEAAARVVAFLRARHPIRAADNVAADAGIAADTVRKWFDRASAPSFGAMLLLIRAYGPEILAAAFERPPQWLDRAARDADRARTWAAIAELQRRLDGGRGDDRS